MAHTPGPWTLHNETADVCGHTLNVRDATRKRIAAVVSNSKADGELLAAAPELAGALRRTAAQLDACAELLAAHDDTLADAAADAAMHARDVLAKAGV